MTPSLQNAARGGLAAAKLMGLVVVCAVIAVLVASPIILAVAWYIGFLSFEAAAIGLLLIIAYGSTGVSA
ncbi:hypothetical protein [Halobacterium noricense]|uniref:hypothetical protein n=1 Tax=Halobacterium noricense TaxID=223182 RepID=UPI001E358F19|nr:hypothetical protein [Halobacterium noricense]UHH26448.1 hypothetical protein LT974_05800 [Halobacterium noricense]